MTYFYSRTFWARQLPGSAFVASFLMWWYCFCLSFLLCCFFVYHHRHRHHRHHHHHQQQQQMTLRDPCGSSQLQDFTSKLRLGPFHHPAGLIAAICHATAKDRNMIDIVDMILLILLIIALFHHPAELFFLRLGAKHWALPNHFKAKIYRFPTTFVKCASKY